MTPSYGGWNFATLYSFQRSDYDFGGPWDKLLLDANGNLYGTTYHDGAFRMGSVFKLARSNGDWIYTSLHDFTGGSDRGYPISSLVFDAHGNLYGTAWQGGANGWEGGVGDYALTEILPAYTGHSGLGDVGCERGSCLPEDSSRLLQADPRRSTQEVLAGT